MLLVFIIKEYDCDKKEKIKFQEGSALAFDNCQKGLKVNSLSRLNRSNFQRQLIYKFPFIKYNQSLF